MLITDLLNENKIYLNFDKNIKTMDDCLDDYLWFIQLIRYEVFDYEENSFFYNKSLNERKQCFLREELWNACKINFI